MICKILVQKEPYYFTGGPHAHESFGSSVEKSLSNLNLLSVLGLVWLYLYNFYLKTGSNT